MVDETRAIEANKVIGDDSSIGDDEGKGKDDDPIVIQIPQIPPYFSQSLK